MIGCWSETYEHAEFGEIKITWLGVAPSRTRLLAIEPDLWTPAAEVAACIEWARNLQYGAMARDGDGDAAASH